MTWQPIETAPRDGTRVLLAAFHSSDSVMLGVFQSADSDDPDDVDGWDTDQGWWPDTDFTHWQPLLDPPKEKAPPTEAGGAS